MVVQPEVEPEGEWYRLLEVGPEIVVEEVPGAKYKEVLRDFCVAVYRAHWEQEEYGHAYKWPQSPNSAAL